MARSLPVTPLLVTSPPLAQTQATASVMRADPRHIHRRDNQREPITTFENWDSMNARRLLHSATIALVAASLVAGSPGALASQQAADPLAAPASSPTVAPSISLDAASLILDAYGAIKQCASDASAGQWWECITGAFSGPSIQDVLNRIDELEKKIDQNHAEVMSRLGQLENAVKQAGLQDRLEDLKKLGNNGDDAMRAWQSLTACMQAQSNAQAQCADFTGTQRPTRDAVRVTSEQFLRIMDRWRDLDLPTVVGDFAGGGGRQGVAEAAWDYFRTKQNNEAGVEGGSPVRASNKVPVVTHALSSQMTSITEYYAGLITRYAFLSAMAESMRSATQLNCGSTPLAQCREDRVRAWQDEASRWINGRSRFQVAGAVDYYAMPAVPNGAIATSGASGRSIVHASQGGDAPLTVQSALELSSRLRAYSSVSKVANAYPGSFPVGQWYRAAVPTILGDFEFDLCGGCGKRFIRDINMHVPVSASSSRQTCNSRVRPVDSEVAWNSRYARQVRYGFPMDANAKEIFRIYGMSRDTFNFEQAWRQSGSNGFLEHDWQSHAMDDGEFRMINFGWGGDLRCSPEPASTQSRVPAGAFPLFGN
jgi:hypothetical protein